MTQQRSIKLQREINAATLKQLLDQQEITLIDVREAGEYASERIPGAILQPLSQFEPQQLSGDQTGPFVLYCQSGQRSGQALERCFAAGLTEVSQLQGGIATWKGVGFAVEKSPNAPISLFRQVQIVAGSLVLIGTLLGAFVSPKFLFLSGFVGAGLIFAGVSNTCAMGVLLSKLPYNQQSQPFWGKRRAR